MLSTRPDLVGPELADELSHLQAASPADPPDVVRSRIESELGAPLESRFAELDLDPIASGSVGQVHDARLPGGERVVVKVQHPDIEERIHTDLDILDSLAELAETRSTELRLLAPRAVARQFRRRMLNELDFERERRNLERFRRQFARDGRVTFPAPIPALSTRRLLTMERIDGRSVRESEALRAAGHDLQALAARGAGVVLKMILGRGYYHADPHPGNVFVLEDGRICMQTVKELLSAAAGEEEGFRSGLVSVVQTFGDRANFHPHVHAVVSRGGWTDSGEWVPVPYVDERAAEELFRHKVLSLLRRRGLVSEERIKLLLSWRRSGFSVHNRVYAHPADGREFEALVRYMSRSPVSLKRLRFAPGSKEVVYTRKGGHDTSEPAQDERIDAEEFVARVLVQIPEPRKHLVRYYGAPPERAALRRRWANLIRRVYEADPLVCPRCGAEMRVVSFITDPRVVKRIVDHLRKRDRPARPPPPHVHQPVASPA